MPGPVRPARSLGELIQVRAAHRERLGGIENVVATGLGLKNDDGDPAVIVYVARKISARWLASGQLVPPSLTDEKSGLSCPVDVVETESEDVYIRTRWNDGSEARLVTRAELVTTDALTGGNLDLLGKLRGGADRLHPGSQLSYSTRDGEEPSATLGCFARKAGTLGFLTNKHVGEFVGNTLWHPRIGDRNVGIVRECLGTVLRSERLPTEVEDGKAIHHVDLAFCEQHQDLRNDEVDPRLLVAAAERRTREQELGVPIPLDLDGMGPIGKNVLGVGRTRGEQRGRVSAFAYEWLGENGWESLDYMIVGEDGAEFSDPGDSGKLIVLDDGSYAPIAILWGGRWERGRSGRDLENLTYATDIGLALDWLGVEVVRSLRHP